MSKELHNPGERQEQHERPRYRFYFHGSFKQFLPSILEHGMKYREYYPFISISPRYSLHFTENEVRRGPDNLRHRARHLEEEKKQGFDPASMKPEDAVLLVLEPPRDLRAHATNQGRPNVFGAFDQIPDDLDSTVYARSFMSPQYELRGKKLIHPGISLDAKRIVGEDGTAAWISKEPSEVIQTPEGFLPPESVKMVIPKTEVFERILEQRDPEALVQYFASGNVNMIQAMTEQDLRELANNMIDGEIEYKIVDTVRKLYLRIEKYKGKKIVKISQRKEIEQFARESPEEILSKIQRDIAQLREMNISNKVIKRYVDVYTKKFESEIL